MGDFKTSKIGMEAISVKVLSINRHLRFTYDLYLRFTIFDVVFYTEKKLGL